jgi:putative sigma-54 modulation protein
MQVIISARGLTVSSTYRDAMTRRLEKIERMWPKIIEAKIVLSREKHRRTAALTLIAKHQTFRSEETAGDLASAVDMAADALERQVREAKDRVKHHKGRGRRATLRAARPAARAARLEDAAEADVAVRRVPLKPMTLAEAAEQLGRGDEGFVVFRNPRTEGLGVLYRRKGGGLGLIEPVA